MTLLLEPESQQAERPVDPPPELRADRFPTRFVAAAIALSIVIRLRFITTPLSSDEGGYLAVARAWASGKSLYTDAWVDRPQGLLLLFRGWDQLTGGSPEAIRGMAIVFGCIAVLGVAYIAFALAGQRAAAIASLLVAVASSNARHRGLHRQRGTAGRSGFDGGRRGGLRLPVPQQEPVVVVRQRRSGRLRHVAEAVGFRRLPRGPGMRRGRRAHARTVVAARPARVRALRRRPRHGAGCTVDRRRHAWLQLMVVRDRRLPHRWDQRLGWRLATLRDHLATSRLRQFFRWPSSQSPARWCGSVAMDTSRGRLFCFQLGSLSRVLRFSPVACSTATTG